MSSIEIETYELFKKHFSEEEAKTVIQYFEAKAEEKINQKKDIFLTKDDKVDLIKWMVGFWIAQMAAIIGLYIRH
jgi:nitrogen fixation protein FixH